MGRVRFWGRSLVAGATWFYRALNPALFAVGLLAVVGVAVAVSLKGSPWLIVLIVALIVLFAFAEGTYPEWQHANASQHQNLDSEQIAREILAEADAVDQAEDERFGERRGDELPPELATEQGRREEKRRLDEKRDAEARPVPKSRPERLHEGKRRLKEDHGVHRRANEAYEAYRARGVMKDGRRFGKPPTPYRPPATPQGKVNITDPDSRNVKTPRGYMQGYNAQAVCNENQIVVAAELNADSPYFGHLEPMVTAAERELATVLSGHPADASPDARSFARAGA